MLSGREPGEHPPGAEFTIGSATADRERSCLPGASNQAATSVAIVADKSDASTRGGSRKEALVVRVGGGPAM
jgi:hypothetical protein